MKSAIGKSPIDVLKIATPIKAIEEQARRNIEMFQNAMRLFTPFPPAVPGQAAAEPPRKEATEKSDELQELKEQIAAMQRKIDSMG